MPKKNRMPLMSRGIIYGIVLGIVLGVVRLFFIGHIYYYLSNWPVFFAFLILIAIIAYKFVGHPVSGILFGLTIFIAQETVYSVVYGEIPFAYFLHYASINYYYMEEGLLSFVGALLVFPFIGFLAGRYSQKRGIVKLPHYGSPVLTELEDKVLSYIKTNNNRIHIVECALALNVEPVLVEKAIKSLQQKGEIQT